MKKIFALVVAIMLVLGTLASCAETTTEAPKKPADSTAAPETTEAPAETTEAPAETTEEPEDTVPPVTTEEEDDEVPPYTVLENPVAVCDGNKLQGYNVAGEFTFDQGIAYSATANSMFIFTNETLEDGILTATFMAPEGDVNDNGIIFGMEDDVDKLYYYWEDGPAYYFLFVSDDCSLYLAKVSFYGNPWEPLEVVPLPDYQHGDEVTISVDYNGYGDIYCYANGELLINYTDIDYLEGGRFGIRCEVPGVAYTSIVAEKR